METAAHGSGSAGLNEEMIEKTITTGDLLTGGLLNPIQQTQFITLVKKFSVLLPISRFIRMVRPPVLRCTFESAKWWVHFFTAP